MAQLKLWMPAVTLDLGKATPRSFDTAVADFHDWAKDQPRVPFNLPDGWHPINPQFAEQLLIRNPKGANRKPKLPSVRYYAEQMVAEDWQKTGQPLIITDQDVLVDGGHRCWACYFSGKPFTTYVISGVPHFDNIFAYIDSGRSRTATDALVTAGLNGQASVISQAIHLNYLYEAGALRGKGGKSKGKAVARPTHIQILRTTSAHPKIAEAAHLQIGEYKTATALIRFKPVAVFCAWKILEHFNEDVLDEYMSSLADSGIPMFSGVRKMFEEDSASNDPMGKSGRLAVLIKLFNAWYSKQTIKKIKVGIEEDFPRFLDVQPQDEAAE